MQDIIVYYAETYTWLIYMLLISIYLATLILGAAPVFTLTE
jgi:hypothetical protein